MAAINLRDLRTRGLLIKLQGREYLTHPALLSIAAENGLKSLRTQIHSWDPETRQAVVVCTAEGERGTYTGIGDACPDNVGRQLAGATLRMAETRAINRALRCFLHIGLCSREELPDIRGEAQPEPAPEPAAEPEAAAVMDEIIEEAQQKLATKQQLGMLHAIARELDEGQGRERTSEALHAHLRGVAADAYGVESTLDMTSTQASELIERLTITLDGMRERV